MAYVQRDPNASGSVHGIPKAYAGVVLVALIGLIILNRAFGSVSVSGGIK
jgi:hypothetical protein